MVCGYLITIPYEGSMNVDTYAQAEIGLALPWYGGVIAALIIDLLWGPFKEE